jgi:hypothetical protein
MERRQLERSIIISANGPLLEKPVTLLGHELGDHSLAFKCFVPLPKGTQLRLDLQFWDRSVTAQAEVLEMFAYNGAWQGVAYLQAS